MRIDEYCFWKSLLGTIVFMLPFYLSYTASAQSTNTAEASTPQQAVVKVCTVCHGVEVVMDTPKDYDAWHDTVQEMLNRGASGTPAELDLVMQFLFETVTTADVNHADADTLSTVLHASPAAIAAIMARRQSRAFNDLADLEASIPALDVARLEAKKAMIFFH